MNGYILQRCFVNLVCSMLAEEMGKPSPRYKSHMEFAHAAFPNESNPVKIWQTIRLGQKGIPRGVSIEEAYAIAQAVDQKIDRLLVKAEMLIEDGWGLEQDISELPKARQPGRPIKNELQKKQAPETQIDQLSTETARS